MLGYIFNYIKSFFSEEDEGILQMNSIDLTNSCIITPTLTPNTMTPLPRNKYVNN